MKSNSETPSPGSEESTERRRRERRREANRRYYQKRSSAAGRLTLELEDLREANRKLTERLFDLSKEIALVRADNARLVQLFMSERRNKGLE